MKREVIGQLESLLAHCKTMLESGKIWERDCEALNIAIAALRGPTREQVEKCFGSMWEFDDEDFDYDWHCGKCECPTNVRPNFCPRCGAAMTDEAINILLKRLEALKDETD